MEIIIHQTDYETESYLDNFLDLLFISQMKYLASDLLEEGLSPRDIRSAVKRAITIGRTSGLEIRQHFAPVYTEIKGELINDCKVSKLGYAMILLNARPDSTVASEWQMEVLKKYFD